MCPFFFGLMGCVNKLKPNEEYLLARSAYKAAVDAEAARYAPNLYHKAERYFKRAEELYEERRYKKSMQYFEKSRGFSERSEGVARLKQFQSGDLE